MTKSLLDALFGSDDPYAEQTRILQELMQEKQQEYAELEGVDSPAAAERREQLNEQMAQLDVQYQQIEVERERAQTMDYQSPETFDD